MTIRPQPSVRVPLSVCSNCGAQNTAAGEFVGDGIGIPNPGDLSMCLHCGHLAAFDDNLRLRPITKKERRDALRDPNIRKILAAQKRLSH